MRLGVLAKRFDGSELGAVLAAAVAAGFSAVQYNMTCSGPTSMADVIPRSTTMAIRAANIEIVALSETYNMIHPDPAVRKLGHARFEVLAAVAPLLPARLITLCTRDPEDLWRAHPDNDAPEAWADVLASRSANLVRLADDLARIGSHAHLLQIDVGDGHFAPAAVALSRSCRCHPEGFKCTDPCPSDGRGSCPAFANRPVRQSWQ